MRVRYPLVSFTLVLAAVGLFQAEAESPRPRREITYDSQWILSDFDHGIEVYSDAEQEERRRRRIRDDGTGAFRDSGRETPSFTPESRTFFPPVTPSTAPGDRRPRNWILPTLDDADEAPSPWQSREERETTGWGWLADEVEQRRAAAAAQQDQQRNETAEETPDDFWRGTSVVGQDNDSRPGPGALLFDANQGGAPNQADSRDLEHLAQLSPDELRELTLRRQDIMESLDPYGQVDPWGAAQSTASPWAIAAADPEAGGAGLFSSSEFTTLWGGAADGNGLGADFSTGLNQGSMWSSGDRVDQSVTSFDAGGMRSGSLFGNAAGSAVSGAGGRMTGEIGFSPTESAGGNWGANWSGGSDWQANPVQSTIGSSFGSTAMPEPTPTQRPASSASPLHNHGWLADR